MKLADGRVLDSLEAVHNGAVNYFADFLKSKQRSLLSNLSFVVEPAITEEDNLMICKVPSMDEVKNAIFSIPIDSNPGPDCEGRCAGCC